MPYAPCGAFDQFLKGFKGFLKRRRALDCVHLFACGNPDCFKGIYSRATSDDAYVGIQHRKCGNPVFDVEFSSLPPTLAPARCLSVFEIYCHGPVSMQTTPRRRLPVLRPPSASKGQCDPPALSAPHRGREGGRAIGETVIIRHSASRGNGERVPAAEPQGGGCGGA